VRHAKFTSPTRGDIDWVPDEYRNPIVTGKIRCEGAFVDGECIAIEGIRPILEDTGEAWMIFRGSPADWPGVVIDFRERFPQLCNGYHRVQAMINLYRPEALRFVRWLGMRPEAILYQSGPRRETLITYVTIKGIDR